MLSVFVSVTGFLLPWHTAVVEAVCDGQGRYMRTPLRGEGIAPLPGAPGSLPTGPAALLQ